MTATTSANLHIKQGVCCAVYALDIGLYVDLAHARRLLAAPGTHGLEVQRDPAVTLASTPPPLFLKGRQPAIPVHEHSTLPEIQMLVTDYGGVSVSFFIPVAGPLTALRALSAFLWDDETLRAAARQKVVELLDVLRPAVTRPALAELAEDYFIFQIQSYDAPYRAHELCDEYRQDLAQILRSEYELLSRQEIDDALACRLSYGADDLAIIDWNAAVIIERAPEDIRIVLEMANLELLELRLLDRELDQSLDRAYSVMASRARLPLFLSGGRRDLMFLAQMQVDGAMVFERVNNALKLLSDQFFARVYRMAAQRFHQGDWNAAILRKLEVMDSLYHKLEERQSRLRLEILEWIIIVLIAFEIVWPFIK